MKTKSKTILRVVSGSCAYGTADGDSDMDIREVVTSTPHQLLGLENFETSERINKEEDVVIHTLSKFFRLLLKGNFNVHEWLWVPEDCVLELSPFGKQLRKDAGCWLHDGIGRSILGYLDGQIKLMQRGRTSTRKLGEKRKAVIEKYGYDTKAAYHAYRLAISGMIMYQTAELPVRLAKGHRDVMLKMKHGVFPFENSLALIENLVDDMRNAREKNMAGLPKKPPYDLLNELLIEENLKLIKEYAGD